ncbi:hypothetical protein B0H13DRAFT_1902818 [Mycena leptocephala]|nr:hypothetical protein B0H13DRAFT_1902818 [Mycena leptocephala]
MTFPALEVQEICDYICDFLHESPADLRAISLVSLVFTSSAQHHLFHVMDLTSGGWYTSQATRATRMCRILHNSPHLIRFIRRLSINFEQDGLVQLAQVHLTHVETIVLGTSRTQCPPKSALSLAAPLIAAPSDLDSLCTLFHQRTSFFDQISLDNVDVVDRTPAILIAEGSRTLQKIMVKGFEIQQSRDSGWLVHPLCPFDLSTLIDISIWCATSPGIITIMDSARSSLHSLRIDARKATSDFALAEFPALRSLDIFSGFGGATHVANLLASVSVGSTAQLPLEHLTIRVTFLGTLDDESFLRLDAAIARLRAPQLRNVHLLVSKSGIPWRGVSSARFVVMVRGLRALFPHSNARGCLALSYIDGGGAKAAHREVARLQGTRFDIDSGDKRRSFGIVASILMSFVHSTIRPPQGFHRSRCVDKLVQSIYFSPARDSISDVNFLRPLIPSAFRGPLSALEKLSRLSIFFCFWLLKSQNLAYNQVAARHKARTWPCSQKESKTIELSGVVDFPIHISTHLFMGFPFPSADRVRVPHTLASSHTSSHSLTSSSGFSSTTAALDSTSTAQRNWISSPGAIPGLVIGGLVFIIILGSFANRQRQRRTTTVFVEMEPPPPPPPPMRNVNMTSSCPYMCLRPRPRNSGLPGLGLEPELFVSRVPP